AGDDARPVVAPKPAAAPAVARPVETPPAVTIALQLCGSNTIGAELAPALVGAVLKRKGADPGARAPGPAQTRLAARPPGAPLVVDVKAAGSATAFQGLLAKSCDIGMASRSVNDKERAQLAGAGFGDLTSPATEHVIGLDGIAVIVHPNNRLSGLDRGQLHD